MTPPPPRASGPAPLPGQVCQVFRARDVFVCHGVNMGDDLGGPDEVCAGDIYQLDPAARPLRLVVARPGDGSQCLGAGGEVGTPGDPVRFEARYALMGRDGAKVELLVISLAGQGRFILPLSPVDPSDDYTLVSVERSPEGARLTDLLCVSFARGTRITLASGAQRAIEELVAGDRVLTRDHGGQPVRWVGRTTLRAVGVFAPVVITAGAMGNLGDLIVSQHHRMFLYQRQRPAGASTSELLIQARHLVDGDRVFLREGGFVDYFSIVFDRHEIIYAEGVPAESLMVNDATVERLPPEIAAEVKAAFPGLAQVQHFGTEAGRQFVGEVGPDRLFAPRDGAPPGRPPQPR